MKKKYLFFLTIILHSTIAWPQLTSEEIEKDIEKIVQLANDNEWDDATKLITSYEKNTLGNIKRLLTGMFSEKVNNNNTITNIMGQTPQEIPFLIGITHKKIPTKVLQAIIRLQKIVVQNVKHFQLRPIEDDRLEQIRLLRPFSNEYPLLTYALLHGTAEHIKQLYEFNKTIGLEMMLSVPPDLLSLVGENSLSQVNPSPIHVVAFGGNLDAIDYVKKILNLSQDDFLKADPISRKTPLELVAFNNKLSMEDKRLFIDYLLNNKIIFSSDVASTTFHPSEEEIKHSINDLAQALHRLG